MDDVAELRQQVEQQRIVLDAVTGTMISVLDIVCHAMQTGGVADRSEIGGRLREIVEKAKTEGDAPTTAEATTRLIGHGLLLAFADQLCTPSSAPAAPVLRIVK